MNSNLNLIGYRKMLELTQGDMADKLKMSRRWYIKKELGQKDFSQTEIENIMKLLKANRPSLTIDEVFLRNQSTKCKLAKI